MSYFKEVCKGWHTEFVLANMKFKLELIILIVLGKYFLLSVQMSDAEEPSGFELAG